MKNLFSIIENKFTILAAVLLIFIKTNSIYSQGHFVNSTSFYRYIDSLAQKGEIQKALKTVDTLSNKNSFVSCELKGYLKSYIYKVEFTKNKKLTDYDSSLFYSTQSINCGYRMSNIAITKYISSIAHNLAANALINGQMDSAEIYYQKSRTAIALFDASLLTQSDVEYYLACASAYYQKYINGNFANETYFNQSIDALKKVIELDSDNYNGNYNFLIFNYNEAIHRLKKAEYCKQIEVANTVDWANPTKPVPSIEKLLECIKPEEYEKYNFTPALKAALPSALKLHKLAPTDKNTIEALVGIYYAIGDKKNYYRYKKLLDQPR